MPTSLVTHAFIPSFLQEVFSIGTCWAPSWALAQSEHVDPGSPPCFRVCARLSLGLTDSLLSLLKCHLSGNFFSPLFRSAASPALVICHSILRFYLAYCPPNPRYIYCIPSIWSSSQTVITGDVSQLSW